MLQTAIILSFFWHLSETFELFLSNKRVLLLDLGILVPCTFFNFIFFKYCRFSIIWHPWDQMGLDYQMFQIIRQYLYWPKFLTGISFYCSCSWAIHVIRGVFCLDISLSCWFFKILLPAVRECALVSHFHFVTERRSLFHYYWPSCRFCFGAHCCKPPTQDLLHLHSFRLFQCLFLENVLHTFDATDDHNLFFHFLMLYTVDDLTLCEAVISPWLSPLSSLEAVPSF